MKKFYSLAVTAMLLLSTFSGVASATSPLPSQDLIVNISHEDKVSAGKTDVYTQMFASDVEVVITVVGDGDTDLDLYIYDENDNLIASDTDDIDTCMCTFTPKWTGKFTIKIKNRGSVYNKYKLIMLQ